MAIARTPLHTAARWHYARLLCTPLALAGTDPTAPRPALVDRATVLQLVSRVLQDLYGTMGGPIGLGEVDVAAIEPSAFGGSEVVIRFPAGATHALLTALPLATLSPFRISILRHAADLGQLAGSAGRGARGYKGWVARVLQAQPDQVPMQQG
ncbi:hypothetical protein BMF94_4116 [Rhodotorula taiwanensis]|uniref:Uncharacterized protein n=1 Tax=Rhodotorula taiwanensis TaxID=741276 RepID=A0A2S5B814_9BASI|nr:hypothetical protein BMF94_4116 [Rhodotorula taiwanensis]